MNLEKKVVVVTGGAGMLGQQYMRAINDINGTAISLDINKSGEYPYLHCDITKEEDVLYCLELIKKGYHQPIYGLINNAALDPKMDKDIKSHPTLSNYSIDNFQKEVDVSLKGSYEAFVADGFLTHNSSASDIVSSKDWATLEQRSKDVVALIKEIRAGK